ncbi:MAG: phosphatidylglycerophosphatase A [Wenzhouxiangella sp.]|nr:phosphatidylglycerophosphatase A [Wenzhouxiangella sp.]
MALSTPAGFLAFGFGSGLSPKAPGTVGSLAAMPFAVVLVQMPLWASLGVVLIAFAAGIHLCSVTGRALGVHDHGGMVWDEFVGFWLVLLFIPFHWAWWLAAFALFRLFDIAKPWPIRWLDRRVGGGLGVMIDDVLAGVYALLPLVLLQRWLAV